MRSIIVALVLGHALRCSVTDASQGQRSLSDLRSRAHGQLGLPNLLSQVLQQPGDAAVDRSRGEVGAVVVTSQAGKSTAGGASGAGSSSTTLFAVPLAEADAGGTS